jgi:hypothetical protein
LRITRALAGVLAALAAVLVAAGTRPPGPSLYGDSSGYLGAAQSLVRQGTLRVPNAPYTSADSTKPLDQWPPGFPALLAIPMRAGASPMASARIVVILSAACTIGLVVLIVGGAAGATWGALAALAVAVVTSVVGTHLEVLSEPPFIALAFLTLALLVWWPDQPLAAGLGAAAAVLVRYVGLGLSGGIALWELLRPGPLATRVRRALEGLVPGVLVYLAWSTAVRRAGGAVRLIHLDRDPVGTVRRFIGSALSWLAPSYVGEGHAADALRVGLKAALLVAIVALVVVLARRRPRDSRPEAFSVASAAAMLAVGVGGLLLVARLLESSVAFYDRMLSPVHALLTVALVAALAAWWSGATSAARRTAALLTSAWFVASAATSARLVHEARTHGLDHTKIGVAPSPMWQWLLTSAPPGPLYTNDPAEVYFQTGRPSRSLPWVMTPDSVRALCTALTRRPGLVVWVVGYTADGLVYPELVRVAATPDRVVRAVPLHSVAQFPDGFVWAPDSSLAGDPRCAVRYSSPP